MQSKRFDPRECGFTTDGKGLFNRTLPDETTIEIYLDLYRGAWSFSIDDGIEFGFNVPTSFDHNTVVALLRANGAMIEGGGDE